MRRSNTIYFTHYNMYAKDQYIHKTYLYGRYNNLYVFLKETSVQ